MYTKTLYTISLAAFFYASSTFSTSIEIKRSFSQKSDQNSQNISLLSPNYTGKFYNFNRGGDSSFSYSDGGLFATNTPLIEATMEELTQKEMIRRVKKYTVVSGDTVSSIAKLFSVSQSTVIIENNIIKGRLKIGQDLTILPVSGIKYKIKSGDNISLIAYRHSVKKEVILDFNQIENEDSIKIGAEIIIPGGKKYAPKKYGSDSFGSDSSGSTSLAGNGNVSEYVNRNGIVPYGKGAKISAPRRKNGRYRYTKTDYGYFTHPAPGSVRTQNPHHRNAIDMGAPVGTKIYAAASGIVTKSYYGG